MTKLRTTALVVALVLGLGACRGGPSSPGVASGGSTSSTLASSSADGSSQPKSAETEMLKFSQCMRSHGVPNFPDPNSQGQIRVTPANGLDMGSAQFQAAQSACKSLLPSSNLTPEQRNAKALAYSKCMRSDGVGDFPDPKGQGTIDIPDATGDLDPGSPTFQGAQKACQSLDNGFSLLENGGGSSPTTH